jgi:hypothetical protein
VEDELLSVDLLLHLLDLRRLHLQRLLVALFERLLRNRRQRIVLLLPVVAVGLRAGDMCSKLARICCDFSFSAHGAQLRRFAGRCQIPTRRLQRARQLVGVRRSQPDASDTASSAARAFSCSMNCATDAANYRCSDAR